MSTQSQALSIIYGHESDVGHFHLLYPETWIREQHEMLKAGNWINLNYNDIAEIIVVLMSARELFVRTVGIPLNFWMPSLLNECLSR